MITPVGQDSQSHTPPQEVRDTKCSFGSTPYHVYTNATAGNRIKRGGCHSDPSIEGYGKEVTEYLRHCAHIKELNADLIP